jgi:hypothetical protein
MILIILINLIYLLKNKIEEINVSLFTDEYNVARYLDALIKKLNLY